jgi:hypothetical protein
MKRERGCHNLHQARFKVTDLHQAHFEVTDKIVAGFSGRMHPLPLPWSFLHIPARRKRSGSVRMC